MKPSTVQGKQGKVVREAIAHAMKTAKNDREFLAALRARVSEKLPDRTRAARSLALPQAHHVDGPRLDDDPRYLSNIRALARRTQRNARILGGSGVPGKEFDDCVAVGNDVEFGCTGTLIAPNVVLTAGHCAEIHTRIFVGNDTRKRGRVYRVKKHVRHSRFDGAFNNDLMILILEKAVAGVKPRAIASTKVIDAATDARLVGFGTTDPDGTEGYGTKRQADVPIASAACRGRVKGRSDGAVYGCHIGKEIVAGKPFLLRDTCRGDSGGPLYISDTRGGWLLAGVTSRGTEGTTTLCGSGGLYTRVDKYRSWIASASK
jgi:secreted trypsin-like serine protease